MEKTIKLISNSGNWKKNLEKRRKMLKSSLKTEFDQKLKPQK